MKLAKLSLAAITVVGLTTSAFAADTLAGAFKNGKVSGDLKAYAMHTTHDATPTSGGNVVGGYLKYKTADLNGFSAGFEFQTSHTLGLNQTDVRDGSISINTSLLSEAYLAYTMDKTTVKVGRQHIETPLVSDSGSRLIRDYFTGAVVANTSLQNTTLVGAYVTDWTDRDGTSTHFDTRPYTVYAATSFAGLGLTAQYLSNDNQDQYWVEAKYSIKTAMPINLGAQYIGVNDTYNSSLYGFKIGTSISGLGLMAAYTTTDNAGKVPGGIGQGNDSSYNSIQKLSGNVAGVDSYQGKVSYNFKNGLSAFTRYVQYSDYSGPGLDAAEWDIDATYKFGGSFKGLKARVRYAMVTKDVANSDFNDFRFIVNYNF